MIVLTKLWVDIKQGEYESEFLIFLLSEESYEADKVVEQEWSQHCRSHLGMPVETTDYSIPSFTEVFWVRCTLLIIITIIWMSTITIITVVSSPEKIVDQLDVRHSVEGWEEDVDD